MVVILISGFLVNPLLINKNFLNSRTSNAIDMKLGSATKLDKRNTAMSKKIDVMPANYDVIDFFIYDQFGTIRKVDSGRMACKSYIFINSNLFITKTKSRTKISLTQFSYYCFE